METPEINRQPEIADQKLEQLLSILDSLEFRNFEEFEFNGKKFLLQILSPKYLEEKEGGAWFAGSTYIDGIDIYIAKKQPPDVRKRKMFHEVVESCTQSDGFDSEVAHNFALEKEQKFFSG